MARRRIAFIVGKLKLCEFLDSLFRSVFGERGSGIWVSPVPGIEPRALRLRPVAPRASRLDSSPRPRAVRRGGWRGGVGGDGGRGVSSRKLNAPRKGCEMVAGPHPARGPPHLLCLVMLLVLAIASFFAIFTHSFSNSRDPSEVQPRDQISSSGSPVLERVEPAIAHEQVTSFLKSFCVSQLFEGRCVCLPIGF